MQGSSATVRMAARPRGEQTTARAQVSTSASSASWPASPSLGSTLGNHPATTAAKPVRDVLQAGETMRLRSEGQRHGVIPVQQFRVPSGDIPAARDFPGHAADGLPVEEQVVAAGG